MDDLIAGDALGFRYEQDWIFRSLSFRWRAGQLTAILGPNGCGKSTLLSIIAGDRAPLEGRVVYRCRGLALVPQSLEVSLPLTGLEMVLLGRARGISLFSAPGGEDYRAAHEALARLEAAHLAGRAFDVMSGGERQLVLIARALASSCSVLLLDEPTAALDWHHQAHVLNLLRQLADEGLAVAFTTHSPQHALDFADTVMVMAGPEQQWVGPPEAVLDEATLSQLYRLPVKRLRLPDMGLSTAIPVFKRPTEDQKAAA